MSASEQQWIETKIAALTEKYGAVPPPWYLFPDIYPYSIGWRMGAGESHMMVFAEWWERQKFTEEQAIDYFRKWPPPPCWLEWLIATMWDVPTWDEDFDSVSYFDRTEQLGFGSKADCERDIEDPRWSEEDH